MAQTTVATTVPKLNEPIKSIQKWIATEGAEINAMMTEVFEDVVLNIPIGLHASKVIHTLFVAKRGYTVTAIDYTPDIAQGGALTACVVKAIGTATPATGTTKMQSSATGINLNGTAHTVQSIALTSTAADLVLAAGNRIAIVLSGAMTVGSGLVSIRMTRT